jgi:hypothetical protein
MANHNVILSARGPGDDASGRAGAEFLLVEEAGTLSILRNGERLPDARWPKEQLDSAVDAFNAILQDNGI